MIILRTNKATGHTVQISKDTLYINLRNEFGYSIEQAGELLDAFVCGGAFGRMNNPIAIYEIQK